MGESAFGGVAERRGLPACLPKRLFVGARSSRRAWRRAFCRGAKLPALVSFKRKAARAGGVGTPGALGVLAASQSSLFEAESSRRGKAGALWETAFPLLHPLPSPRSTPSLGYRGEPCFRLLPAFGKSREDRFLPASPSRASHGPRALARRAGSCLRALTPRAFAVSRDSGGRASGNNQRKRELPAHGLGASRQGVEVAREGELREVASGRKALGRF